MHRVKQHSIAGLVLQMVCKGAGPTCCAHNLKAVVHRGVEDILLLHAHLCSEVHACTEVEQEALQPILHKLVPPLLAVQVCCDGAAQGVQDCAGMKRWQAWKHDHGI